MTEETEERINKLMNKQMKKSVNEWMDHWTLSLLLLFEWARSCGGRGSGWSGGHNKETISPV